jgi:hypothetical protein
MASLLNGIVNDLIWINKGGLKIPNAIIEASSQRSNWFNGLNAIIYSKENFPDLESILGFSSEELEEEVQFSAYEVLQSSYGANKASNSRTQNSSAVGNQMLNAIAARPANIANYTAAVEVNNFLIDWQRINFSSYRNNDDIFEKIKLTETDNKSWLGSKINDGRKEAVKILDELISHLETVDEPMPKIVDFFVDAKAKFTNNFPDAVNQFIVDIRKLRQLWEDIFIKFREELAKILDQIKQALFGEDGYKEAVSEARRVRWERVDYVKEVRRAIVNPYVRAIRKVLTSVRNYVRFNSQARYSDQLRMQFQTISSSYSAIAINPAPNNLDAYNVLDRIARSILSTFILKNAKLPWTIFEAIKNTVNSIVSKRFRIPAGEAIRRITGGLLRSNRNLLPAVFNNTGMFAGVWGVLVACAPYILAASILIIIAINMAKKNKLGNFIWLLGLMQGQEEPNVCFARIKGDSLERMRDIERLKLDFIEETNKNYRDLYVLSFTNQRLERCFKFNEKTPKILQEDSALAIKSMFSGLEYMPF